MTDVQYCDPMRYLELARIDPAGIRRGVSLPYGLEPEEVTAGADLVHQYLYRMNNSAVEHGFPRFEETLLGNTFAGMLSELIVVSVGSASATLTRNMKTGGHPDLILAAAHDGDSVLRAEDGVEIKTSKQSGGWQGHNAEKAWLLGFQYAIDIDTEDVEDRYPTEIVKIMCAKLTERHWSFSGRNEGSRRTPTASILKEGTALLHDSAVYERPGYIRNKGRMREVLLRAGEA